MYDLSKHAHTGYYAQNSACLPCAGDSADRAELATILIIGIVLVLIVGIAASTLDDKKMGNVVGAIVIFQRGSVVGGSAATAFANTDAGTFFRYLSLVNLNIQVVKPGCSVPVIGFVNLFW